MSASKKTKRVKRKRKPKAPEPSYDQRYNRPQCTCGTIVPCPVWGHS